MSTARFHDFADTVPTMPAGLDQQGRYPTRPLHRSAITGRVVGDDEAEADWMRAAECCTDLGAELRGKHTTGPLGSMFLRLRRWALG